MFKIVEVKKVEQSTLSGCTTIRYEDDGMLKYAACVDGLTVHRGDKVEIYSDDYVDYCGFGAMALRSVQGVGCVEKKVKAMDLFSENETQDTSAKYGKQFVEDSLVQIWGRFLGYPVNYATLNIIEERWRCIYDFSKRTFENASPDDFNRVIDFVVSTVDKEFGVYQSLIYSTVASHEET